MKFKNLKNIDIRTNEYCSYMENADGVELVSYFACDNTSDFDNPQRGDGHWDVITSWVLTRAEMAALNNTDILSIVNGKDIDIVRGLKTEAGEWLI